MYFTGGTEPTEAFFIKSIKWKNFVLLDLHRHADFVLVFDMSCYCHALLFVIKLLDIIESIEFI
jgi:hypothetical protein